MNKKGYTLLEIIIVIIILGVLVAVALPRFNMAVERARAAEGVQILEAMRNGQIAYWYENNETYADDEADLEIQVANPQNFDPPEAVDGTGGIIATVERDGTNGGFTYILDINVDGDINCTLNGSPANTCTQIGYPP